MSYLFVFNPQINGFPTRIQMELPVSSNYVITNQFRPDIYPKSAAIVGMQAGESISDFYTDCNNIINAASTSQQSEVDALVEGLISVVKSHIQRCGRLIFGDLMIYLDCWAHILKGAGVSDQDVKDYYSVELGILVTGFLPHIKDDSTLTPFSETQTFIAVKKHVNEVAIRLNGKPFFELEKPRFRNTFESEILGNITRRYGSISNADEDALEKECLYYATDMSLEFYDKSDGILPKDWQDHIFNEVSAVFDKHFTGRYNKHVCEIQYIALMGSLDFAREKVKKYYNRF